MIYRLQKKFIAVSALSILAAVVLVLGLVSLLNLTSMNRNLDILADSIYEGNGRFPDRFKEEHPPKRSCPTKTSPLNLSIPKHRLPHATSAYGLTSMET